MPQSVNQRTLESRVIRAAETTLSNQQNVSAVDVLCGMGLLHASNVDLWRKGQNRALGAGRSGNRRPRRALHRGPGQ